MDQYNGTSPYTENGYLIVSVSEADRAVPLSGALVTIKGADKENSGVIYALRTDKNGRTERVALPAPRASASMSPGGPRPYAQYNIEIDLQDYFSQNNLNVPIFSGITAIQNADLVPRSQNENLYPQGDTRFYEGQSSYLGGSGNDA